MITCKLVKKLISITLHCRYLLYFFVSSNHIEFTSVGITKGLSALLQRYLLRLSDEKMSKDKDSDVLDYRDLVFQLGEEPKADRHRLYEFSKEKRYVDVTLTFDDGTRIPCHRCVLASCSSYFDIMFSNGMKESSEEEIRVVDVSSEVMSLAIEFVYTRRLKSTYEHFFELLLVANMYELKELEREILRHLIELLDRLYFDHEQNKDLLKG